MEIERTWREAVVEWSFGSNLLFAAFGGRAAGGISVAVAEKVRRVVR